MLRNFKSAETRQLVQKIAQANNQTIPHQQQLVKKKITKSEYYWPFVMEIYQWIVQRVSNAECVSMSWHYHGHRQSNWIATTDI